MDVGIPHSLLTPAGEIVFNDLTGNATAASLAGVGGHIWPGPGVAAEFPLGLPDGNGYLMQFISANAPYRNPVDIRPHKHGGILHRFFASAKYFTLSGQIIATEPEYRTVLYDYLRGFIFSSMQTPARYFYKPSGRAIRFWEVYNYDDTGIIGPGMSPGGSPSGIAAPKQYDAQFVSAFPFAQSYTERDNTVAMGDSISVPNDGTVETWPVIQVHGPFDSFALSNGTFTLEWQSAVPIPLGHYIEVNMYNETLYKDGNSTNELGGVVDQPSDFWSIPPGGCTISFAGVSSGSSTALIKSNDAWA